MARKKLLFIGIFYIITTIVTPFIPISPTAAVGCEGLTSDSQACKDGLNGFYSSNDILFYDKYGSETVDCPPIGDSSSVPAGGSNAEKFYKFLVGRGLSAKQAAGIIGNVMVESGGKTFNIDPNALNSQSGAYGIVQWTNGRKAKLLAYAESQGKPKEDLGVQMNYVWIELNGDYKKAVLDPLKATSDVQSATMVWLEHYEIPCLPGQCGEEMGRRLPLSNQAYTAFSGLSVDQVGAVATSAGCEGASSGVVDPSGYAFPVTLPKDLISNGYSWPCRTDGSYCHHDGSAAFDLSKKPNNQTAGTPVVAIYTGQIIKINPNYMNTGCQSIQFRADDGYSYWYGHIRTDSGTPALGRKVSAGQYLAKVGESACTGNGSYAHLHIDRGFPKGHTGGGVGNRDPAFITVMNTLYSNLK